MRSRTSGGLNKFSVALSDQRLAEVDSVREDITPPSSSHRPSRNFAIDYLLGLGLAQHRKELERKATERQALSALTGAAS